jgi:hypothetical protein
MRDLLLSFLDLTDRNNDAKVAIFFYYAKDNIKK